MKIRFDLQNRIHRSFLILWVTHVMFAIQIVKLEAERRALGFIALGLLIISTIFLRFSNRSSCQSDSPLCRGGWAGIPVWIHDHNCHIKIGLTTMENSTPTLKLSRRMVIIIVFNWTYRIYERCVGRITTLPILRKGGTTDGQV